MLKTLLILIAVVGLSTTALSFSGSKKYITKFNPNVTENTIQLINDSVIDASSEYSIDAVVILGVMKTESYFDQYARSSYDAVGLMQIRIPVWFETLKKRGLISTNKDFYSIVKNTNSGVYILSLYRSQCNDDINPLKCTLQRYNGNRAGYKYYQRVLKSIKQYYKLHSSIYIKLATLGAEQIRLVLFNSRRRFVVDLSGLRKNSINQYLQTTQTIHLM